MFKLEQNTQAFTFEYAGKEYSLPLMDSIPAREGMRIANLPKSEQDTATQDLLLAMIDNACGTEFLDTITSMQLQALVEEWSKASSATVGE